MLQGHNVFLLVRDAEVNTVPEVCHLPAGKVFIIIFLEEMLLYFLSNLLGLFLAVLTVGWDWYWLLKIKIVVFGWRLCLTSFYVSVLFVNLYQPLMLDEHYCVCNVEV